MSKIINSFSTPASPQDRGSITMLKDSQSSQIPGVSILGINFNNLEFQQHQNLTKINQQAQSSSGSIGVSPQLQIAQRLSLQPISMSSGSQQDHRMSFPGVNYSNNSTILYKNMNSQDDLSQHNMLQPQIPKSRSKYNSFISPSNQGSVILQNNSSQQAYDKVRSLSSNTRNNLSNNSIGNNNSANLYNSNHADIQRNNNLKFSANNNSGISNGIQSTYHSTSKKVDPINETILKHEKKLKEILENQNISNSKDSNFNLCQSYGGNLYLTSQPESQTYQRIYLVNNTIQVSPKKTVFKTVVSQIQKQPENIQHYPPTDIYSQNQSPIRSQVQGQQYNNFQAIKSINQIENNNSNYSIGSPNVNIKYPSLNSGSPLLFNSPNIKFSGIGENEMQKNQGIQINSPSQQMHNYQVPQSQINQSQQQSQSQLYSQSQQLPLSKQQFVQSYQFPQTQQSHQQLQPPQQQQQNIIQQQTEFQNQQYLNQNNNPSSSTLTFAKSNASTSRRPSVDIQQINPQQNSNTEQITLRITQLLEKYQQRTTPPKLNPSQNSFNYQENLTQAEKSEQNSYTQLNDKSQNQVITQNPNIQNQFFFTKPIDIPKFVQEPQTSSSIPEYSPINNLYGKSHDKHSFAQQNNTPITQVTSNEQMNKIPTLNTQNIQNSGSYNPEIKSPFIQSPIIKSPAMESSNHQNNVMQISNLQNPTKQPQSLQNFVPQYPQSQLIYTNSNKKLKDQQINYVQQHQPLTQLSNSAHLQQNLQNSSQTQSKFISGNLGSPAQNSLYTNPILSQTHSSIPSYIPLLYPAYNGVENPLRYIRQYSQSNLSRNTSQENIRHSSHSPLKGSASLDQGKPIFLSQTPSLTGLLQPQVQQPFQAQVSLPIISNIITSSPQGLKSQKIQVKQTTLIPLEGGLQLNTQVTTEHEVKDMNNNPVLAQHIFLNNCSQDQMKILDNFIVQDNSSQIQNLSTQNQNKLFTFQTYHCPLLQNNSSNILMNNQIQLNQNHQDNLYSNDSDQKNRNVYNQPYLNLSTQQKFILQPDSDGDQYQEIINQISYHQPQETQKEACSFYSNQNTLDQNKLSQSPQKQVYFTEEENQLTSNKKYIINQTNSIFTNGPVLQNIEYSSQQKKNQAEEDKDKKRVFSFSKEQNSINNPQKTKLLEENVDQIIGNIFQQALNKVNDDINIKRSQLDSQMNAMSDQRQKLQESTQNQNEKIQELKERLSLQQQYQNNQQFSKLNTDDQNIQVNQQQTANQDYIKQSNQLYDQSLTLDQKEKQFQEDRNFKQGQAIKEYNEQDQAQFEIFKKIENGNHIHVQMTEEQKKELAQSLQKTDSLEQLMMEQLNENKKLSRGSGSKSNLGNSVSSMSRFNGKESVQSLNLMKSSQDSLSKNNNKKSQISPNGIQSLNRQYQNPQQEQNTYSFFQNSQPIAPTVKNSSNMTPDEKSQFSFIRSDEKKINNYQQNSIQQNPNQLIQKQGDEDTNFVFQQHIQKDIIQPQIQYEQKQFLRSNPEIQTINPTQPNLENIQLESPQYESESKKLLIAIIDQEELFAFLFNFNQLNQKIESIVNSQERCQITIQKKDEILKKIDKLNKKSIEGIYQSQNTQTVRKGSGQASPQKLTYQQQNYDDINQYGQKSYDIDEMRKNKRASNSIPSHIIYESNKKQAKKRFDMNEYMINAVSESEMKNQIDQFDILRQNDHESPERRNLNRSQNSSSKSPKQDKNKLTQNQIYFNESQFYGRKLRACEIQALLEGRQLSNSPNKTNYINSINQSKIQNQFQRKQQEQPSPNSQKAPQTPSQKNCKLISSNMSNTDYQKSTPKNNEQKISYISYQQNIKEQNKILEQAPNQNSHISNSKSPIRQAKDQQFKQNNIEQKEYEQCNSYKKQTFLSNIKQEKINQSSNYKTQNAGQSYALQNNKHIENVNNKRKSDQINKYHKSPQKIKQQDIYIEQGYGNYQINDLSQQEMNLMQNSENIVHTSYKQNINNQNNKINQKNQVQPQIVEQSQNHKSTIQSNSQNLKRNTQKTTQQNQQKPQGNYQMQQQSQLYNKGSEFLNQNQQINQNYIGQQNYNNEQPQSLKYQTKNSSQIISSPKNIIQNINDMKKYSEYMFANNQNLLKELDQKSENNSSRLRSSSRNRSINNGNSQGRSLIKEIGSFFKERQEQESFPVTRSNNSSLIRGKKKFIEDGDANSSRIDNSSQKNLVNNQDQQILYNPNQNKLYVQIRKNIHSISPPNSKSQQQENYINLPNYSSKSPNNQQTQINNFL